MNKDLLAVFEYLEREKGIKREIIIDAIKESLQLAASKSLQGYKNVKIEINPKIGEIEVWVQKTVVDKITDPNEEILLSEAKMLEDSCEVGQRIEISVEPHDFGRIAAQTARQVITQKLRMAERDVIYEEYRHRIGEIISGSVKQIGRGRTVIIDLGKVHAVMPFKNYPINERYNLGERVQALLYEVRDLDNGGAEVVLTRAHTKFVEALFKQEVPELKDEIIVIDKIVREPGYRTKMVVKSTDDRIDPVGTCVGLRGTRIKNVIREINENIDVIPFDDDTVQLLKNIISPVEVKRLKIKNDKIILIVNDEDYPIIIGKKGLNVRLISRLMDKEMDVQKITEYQKFIYVQLAEISEKDDPMLDEPLQIDAYSQLLVENLISNGFDSIRKILKVNPQELVKSVPGVNYLDLANKILDHIENREEEKK